MECDSNENVQLEGLGQSVVDVRILRLPFSRPFSLQLSIRFYVFHSFLCDAIAVVVRLCESENQRKRERKRE